MRYNLIPVLVLLTAAFSTTTGYAQTASAGSATATVGNPVATTKQPPPAVAPAAVEGNAGTGKQLFNSILGCSHCHGVNSVGHTDKRNLREIKKRNGADWEQVYASVIKEGRTGTAMPPWSHLSPKQVGDIKAFILSIQEE